MYPKVHTVADSIDTRLGGIDTLLARIDTRLDDIDMSLDRVNTNVTTLTTRVSDLVLRQNAADHNNVAIFANSRLQIGSLPLHTLLDPTTNAVIPNFPATGDAIKALPCKSDFLPSRTVLTLVAGALDALIAAVGMGGIGGLKEASIVAFKDVRVRLFDHRCKVNSDEFDRV
jgi:hypothetical protein